MKKNSAEDKSVQSVRTEETSGTKNRKWNIFFEGLMLLATVGLGSLAAYVYGHTAVQITGIAILTAAGMGSVWFLMEECYQKESWLFDNGEHMLRFMVIYMICLAASLFFPLLPDGGWPYLAVFIGLMLFSNQVIGLSAGAVLLLMTVLLQESGTVIEFFVYFVCSLVGITVFSYVDETFRIWLPILVSLLIQGVGISVLTILYVNEAFQVQMLYIPFLNVLVSLLLLLILLKYFSYAVVYRRHGRYMDINDPECELLVKLKTASREEYYHAVHTAYLCDRIAKRLNMDAAVVKACGYYHRIGILRGENNWENVRDILREADFPEEVMAILKEYLDKKESILSRETVVLLFSDTIISSISYLFSKDPKIRLDYDQIVEAIFKKKTESGIIDRSRITFGEFQEMKKILAEEKLYYDFLR